MLTDTIADFATRLRNASLVNKETITLKNTKLIKTIADVMVSEHYLESASVEDGNLTVKLVYVATKPAINSIKRISKPGMRIYKKGHELSKVLSGLGIGIVSTSRGVMSNTSAVKQNLGGEVLLELW
ncbi:MAG: 30S ribosomal protein S8 [bacterium]